MRFFLLAVLVLAPIPLNAQEFPMATEFIREAEKAIPILKQAEEDCRRIGIPILSECVKKFLDEIKRQQAADSGSSPR